MRGVYTALVTPFLSNGELDLPAFKKILKNQKEAGVTGVIPCGTTGESPTLSLEEKKILIHTALSELKGTSVQVLAGTGSNNTAETVALSRWASEQGVSAVLVVTPYYNKPSQTGLELHFLSVADAVRCEVLLYNVPGRTGVSLSAETICKLAQHPRITSIKEATANPAFASEIMDALAKSGRRMDILSGDDGTYLSLLSVGATGIVSVASNLIPRTLVAIQNAAMGSLLDQAFELHRKFFPVFRDLFIDSNPVPLKHAMALMGWCENIVRLPLAPLSPQNALLLEATLTRCGVSKGGRL